MIEQEEKKYNEVDNAEGGGHQIDEGRKQGDIQHLTNGGGSQSGEQKQVDVNELDIDPDLITKALARFYE